jgi:hypothetical protein
MKKKTFLQTSVLLLLLPLPRVELDFKTEEGVAAEWGVLLPCVASDLGTVPMPVVLFPPLLVLADEPNDNVLGPSFSHLIGLGKEVLSTLNVTDEPFVNPGLWKKQMAFSGAVLSNRLRSARGTLEDSKVKERFRC